MIPSADDARRAVFVWEGIFIEVHEAAAQSRGREEARKEFR